MATANHRQLWEWWCQDYHCNAKRIWLECLKFSHIRLYLEPVLTSHGVYANPAWLIITFQKQERFWSLENSGRIFPHPNRWLYLAGPSMCWCPISHVRMLKILCWIALQIALSLSGQGSVGRWWLEVFASRHSWEKAALSVFHFEICAQDTTDARKCCSLGWE